MLLTCQVALDEGQVRQRRQRHETVDSRAEIPATNYEELLKLTSIPEAIFVDVQRHGVVVCAPPLECRLAERRQMQLQSLVRVLSDIHASTRSLCYLPTAAGAHHVHAQRTSETQQARLDASAALTLW